MAARLGSTTAGGPGIRSLPSLLTGAAGRPGDSGGCPRVAGGRHGDPGKAGEGLRGPQVLPAAAAAAASAPSAGTAAVAASAPSAGTAAASAPSAGTAASTATAARPAVGQEPLHRRQMYLIMHVNNDYKLETEKNCHFYQLGCRKIWTSGFHKWAECLS
nr:paired mesoderm homeobox protein 2B-like isoform X2 [Vicugna pacos]